jgi:hypothetical protein
LPSRYVNLSDPDTIKGEFTFVRENTGWTTILYEFSADRYEAAGEDPNNPTKISLLRISPDDPEVQRLVIYPVNTLPNNRFLQPKYDKLRTIAVENSFLDRPTNPDEVGALLDDLPDGFVKDPEFGLGLLKDYRCIVDAVEAIPGIKHLVISDLRETAIDGDTYVLASRQYSALRRAIDRTHRHALERAREDKSDLAYNSLLHQLDNSKFPEKHRPYKPDTVFRAVAGGTPKLSHDDQLAAVTLVKQSRRALADRHPEQLMELQRDIELVTLERLIDELVNLMRKKTTEPHWHKLFVDNPFILSLAFGLPVIAIGDQVSVGGRTFFGAGEKIADFLVKNDMTDNLALIEIKTAHTKLLGRPYRLGVFPPSADLAGAVTQVLDQRCRLQTELHAKKATSRRYDLEAYAVRCVVIIGTTPEEREQKRSLELFRNNLHDTLIVTFDELLVKLRHLQQFLAPPTPSA